MQNDNTRSYLQLHFIVFIWGFTAVLGALISLDALPLVWWRMALATLFVMGYMLLKKVNYRLSVKAIGYLLVAGLIIAMHWLTFFKAIKVSNVSVTLACLSTGAFFASFLEPILNGKKIIWYEVVLGIIVVFGLYLIFTIKGDYLLGILLALTSAFLSALFSVMNGKLAKEYDASVISLYELSGGVFFLSLYLLFTGGFSIDFFKLSASDLGWLLLLASICTAYAFIASVKVMKHLSAYTVMLTINLEPIYGILLALLIFKEKEQMGTNFYIGAIIILLTVLANVVIKNYLKRKRRKQI